MNIRRRMILKAFKRYIPSGERIIALMDFIDKYGNYDIHTKKKNYHTSVEVKI